MRTHCKFLLIGLSAIALSACSSNEERIDVTKPEMSDMQIDLKTGQSINQQRFESDFNGTLNAMSTSNVQIFSLDGPSPNLRGQAMSRSNGAGFGAIGNSNVEITNIGQPTTPRYMTSSAPRMKTKKNINSVVEAINQNAMETVYFGHNSSRLDASDMQAIENVLRQFNAASGKMISIEGHASMPASVNNPVTRKQINLDVSLERAESVADVFIARGVPGNKIRTVGWGEDKPIVATAGMSDEAAARRVEILFVSGQ